jgi:hypothetical protein
MNQPIRVVTHLIRKELPDRLKDVLPTIEQLETELDNAVIDKICSNFFR